jgi:hypothetical protein
MLNKCSEVLEIHIHNQLCFCVDFKLHPILNGFVSSKPIATNLATQLNKVTPIVCSQAQAASICFGLNQIFE